MGSEALQRPAGLNRDARVAGRYRIGDELGRGGVSTVYAAHDEHSGAQLALKLLALDPDSRTAPRDIALFQREYYTLAQIAHPGIVRVFEYAIDERGPFYTMELLDGRDLREAATMPWREVCAVLGEVASALAVLHSRRLIHRDVSHRNVRLTARGRCKLFDFGAMTPMGFVPEVIGTPPFVSPEAAHGEALDQRSDLYSLGALGYFLLSGRHAFPAQSFKELRELFANGSAQPRLELGENVPSALAALVLALLQRDPIARPASAAEVIDRLNALLGAAPEPDPRVARAYLVNPKLVGRRPQLRELRAAVEHGCAGGNSLLLIEGGSGTGKTRLLHELAIAAQLHGASVLRVSGTRTGRASHSLARTVLEELRKKRPDAFGARRGWDPALAWLMPQAAGASGSEPEPARPKDGIELRARAQTEACNVLLAESARQPIVIAVDDAHACDDDSIALLAALSGEPSRAQLVIAISLPDSGSDAHPGLALLRSRVTHRAQLRGFDAAETEQLVASLFGDAPSSQRLAHFLQERARGNPLECMALARQLVERGAVRYIDGAWVLPHELPDAISSALSQPFRARVLELDGEARELSEILALYARPMPLSLGLACSPTHETARLFAGFERLVANEIAVAHGDAYALSRPGIRDALLEALPNAQRRALHQRIGEALETQTAPRLFERFEAAYHLLRGESPLLGVSRLERVIAESEALPEIGREVIAAIELALEVCAAHNEPRKRSIRLEAKLLYCAFLYDRRLLSRAQALIEQLHEDSGLALAKTLPHDPHSARLWRALTIADARHTASDPATRGLRPVEALSTLAEVVAATLAGAIFNSDRSRIRWLADVIEPWSELPRTIGLAMVDDLVQVVVLATAGQFKRANATRLQIFERLADPTMYQQVSDNGKKRALVTQLHAHGMLHAAYDRELPLLFADRIDATGLAMYAGAAVQLRLLAALYGCDERAANALFVRMESLSLQAPAGQQTEMWLLSYVVEPYAALADVIALKRVVERVAVLVEAHAGYRSLLFLSLGAYYRARGQLEAAQRALENARELAPRGWHSGWGPTFVRYTETLVARGEYARALELARENLETGSDELGETLLALACLPHLAFARAKLGEREAAKLALERALASANSKRLPLLRVCLLHASRARIAILEHERSAFERHAGQVASFGRAFNNALLMAEHARLCDEAAQTGLIPRALAERDRLAAACTATVAHATHTTQLSLPPAIDALLPS